METQRKAVAEDARVPCHRATSFTVWTTARTRAWVAWEQHVATQGHKSLKLGGMGAWGTSQMMTLRRLGSP